MEVVQQPADVRRAGGAAVLLMLTAPAKERVKAARWIGVHVLSAGGGGAMFGLRGGF